MYYGGFFSTHMPAADHFICHFRGMQNSQRPLDIFSAEYLSITGFLQSASRVFKTASIFFQKSDTASLVCGISKTA